MSDFKTQFLADVARHEMTVLLDQGCHRHLRFCRPGSSVLSFNITTWPGYLAITGDCNDYVFARLTDMFRFFRADPDLYETRDTTNPDYWAEKAVAIDRGKTMTVFSQERYTEAVRDCMRGHIQELSLAEAKIFVREVKEDLLERHSMPGSRSEAIDMTARWECPVTGTDPFTDFWDRDLEDYGHGYLWAIQAIQWAIRKYDTWKACNVATSMPDMAEPA